MHKEEEERDGGGRRVEDGRTGVQLPLLSPSIPPPPPHKHIRTHRCIMRWTYTQNVQITLYFQRDCAEKQKRHWTKLLKEMEETVCKSLWCSAAAMRRGGQRKCFTHLWQFFKLLFPPFLTNKKKSPPWRCCCQLCSCVHSLTHSSMQFTHRQREQFNSIIWTKPPRERDWKTIHSCDVGLNETQRVNKRNNQLTNFHAPKRNDFLMKASLFLFITLSTNFRSV